MREIFLHKTNWSTGAFFKNVTYNLFCCLIFLNVALVISACSSSDIVDTKQAVVVTDPINFQVTNLNNIKLKTDLSSNIQSHLDSLAVISKKRAVFYVREIKETTRKALRAYGYYQPEINVVLPNVDDEQDLTVIVQVDAGKPLFIRNCNVEILGEGAEYKIFNDILKNSKLSSYQIINHGEYESIKSKLHEAALSLGFFDGKFISSRILVYQDQNMADIDLIYDSGKRYEFGDIIASEETTVLLRPSTSLKNFKRGEPYSTEVINNFVQALSQTNYYATVDVRPDLSKVVDYQVPLEVRLERKANNNMRLGLGYSTDEGPQVLAEWNKPLLNDRGDSLSTLVKGSRFSQDAQAIYKIPRKNPNSDYYTINAIQNHTDLNDTLSDRSHFSVHYIANDTGSWMRDYSLRAEYEDYHQASEYDYSFNIMPGLTLSRRESTGGFDPSRGYFISAEMLGASSVISDLSFFRFLVTYKAIISPTERSRLFLRAQHGAILGPASKQVPPSLRFFAGGDNSIRGFGYRTSAPRQLDDSGLRGGRYMTTGTVELQFPFGVPNSRLAVFLDGGLATDDYQSDILWGPGIGYRFLSPYGTVKVDFAVGLQSDEENNYRIHFAFGPEF